MFRVFFCWARTKSLNSFLLFVCLYVFKFITFNFNNFDDDNGSEEHANWPMFIFKSWHLQMFFPSWSESGDKAKKRLYKCAECALSVLHWMKRYNSKRFRSWHGIMSQHSNWKLNFKLYRHIESETWKLYILLAV